MNTHYEHSFSSSRCGDPPRSCWWHRDGWTPDILSGRTEALGLLLSLREVSWRYQVSGAQEHPCSNGRSRLGDVFFFLLCVCHSLASGTSRWPAGLVVSVPTHYQCDLTPLCCPEAEPLSKSLVTHQPNFSEQIRKEDNILIPGSQEKRATHVVVTL